MAQIQFELQELYQRQFGSKPKLAKEVAPSLAEGFKLNGNNSNYLFTTQGSNLKTELLGQEVWLPVLLLGLDYNRFGATELLLPHAVIKISGRKNFTTTPLAERGDVIEEYSIHSYDITINGFLIDKNRVFPAKELEVLQKLYVGGSMKLDNALTNIFLDEGGKGVYVAAFDLPEVEGGRKHVRPFTMKLISDNIFTLELE